MKLKNIKKAYFIGIGGIGMSAVARYFNHLGIEVLGYDKTATVLTKQLEKEGMKIRFKEDVESLPKDVDIVVYTPAIPNNHSELSYYQRHGFFVKKRSETLELITENAFTIAIAGSHGKTSVTSMLTHILKHSGYDCTAFVGGIMLNYNSNFVIGKNDVIVVEADEYDRSFLRLQPNIAVITAVDTDHLDIYGTRENIEAAFLQFTKQIKEHGTLIVQKEVSIIEKLQLQDTNNQLFTYSIKNKQADSATKALIIDENGSYQFLWQKNNKQLAKVHLHIGGWHNVENALAAMTVAKQLGIEAEKISKAMADFKGIYRRFEYLIRTPNLVMIDDYAHHPEEIKALLHSVRSLYADKQITVIFQPHLYSRTKDLAVEFAESLSLADRLILLNIYPARELPIEGVSSHLIFEKATAKQKMLCHYDDLLKLLETQQNEVLLTVGAGNIDKLVQPIKKMLLKTI
ncbi:MAG: UDP-N-acetylmuramate--L-alanine ligase [Chitinophagales bacterium]